MSDQNLPIVFDSEPMAREDLGGLQGKAWIAGGLGAAGLAAGYFTAAPKDFFGAYLVGWLWVVTLALGLFGLSLLGHITGGYWTVMMRRISEASGRTLPFVFVFGIPIAFGMPHVFPWAIPGAAEPGHEAYDALVAHKAPWLSFEGLTVALPWVPPYITGFFGRAVIYFAFWTVLAYILSSWSRKVDETGDSALRERMKRWSAGGLVFFCLIGTFASVDWIMSVAPHWFSSLFGFSFVGGQGLAAFAFMILAMKFLRDKEPFKRVVKTKIFHDYGKFMLAFTMLWGYFSVSQFLIIWSGNLPEEVTWYLYRNTEGWKILTLFLVAGHFFIPFLLLLSADLKKKPKLIGTVAIWILVMRWVDFYWHIMPSVNHKGGVWPGWLDLVAPIGLGGLWLALLIGQFQGRKALPNREPVLQEVSHG